MRIPMRTHCGRLDDEGAALAAIAACGLVGVLVATALTMEELVALIHPLLPYMH